MERYFEFHWKNGEVEYGKGATESEAASSLGITLGCLGAMDYVCESKEIPMESKAIRFISKNGKDEILSNGTLFVQIAREQIAKSKMDIKIQVARAIWNCKVEVTPFELILREY